MEILYNILHFLSEKVLREDTLTEASVFLRTKLTWEDPCTHFSEMPQKRFRISLYLR